MLIPSKVRIVIDVFSSRDGERNFLREKKAANSRGRERKRIRQVSVFQTSQTSQASLPSPDTAVGITIARDTRWKKLTGSGERANGQEKFEK